MKLEKYNKDAEIIGNSSVNEFSIDPKEAARVMNYLIDLYMDPVGSVVREITSNCIDAHRERDLKIAGKVSLEKEDVLDNFETRNTVLVRYTSQNSILGIGASISFKDWGVGLSEERVSNIYTKLGASTKRESNDEIGGFGIGCKSPFAYVTTFYITAIHNKVKRCYMLSRNNESPSMDMVFSEECNEKNSTEVVIPLKGEKDKLDFARAINDQLTFFKNVVFENIEEECGTIYKPEILDESDEYIITKGTGTVKALIGNVVYNLDFNQIEDVVGGNSYPVYIKFNIGEISIVPSREGIQYNEETIDFINSRINSVTDKFKEDSIKHMSEETDIIKFIRICNDIGDNRYTYRSSDKPYDEPIAVKSKFSNCVSDTFLFKGSVEVFSKLFTEFFKGISVVMKIRAYNAKYSGNYTLTESHVSNFTNIGKSNRKLFYVKDKCKRAKDLAMINDFGESWIKFSKNVHFDESKHNDIWNYLIESECVEDYESYNQVSYNDDDGSYITEEEKRRLNQEVFGKVINIDYDGNFKWKMCNHKISEIESSEDLIIYGFPSDEKLLSMAGFIFRNIKGYFNRNNSSYGGVMLESNNLKILKISVANEKHYMNGIYVKEFFGMEHKLIKQWYTAYLIKDKLPKMEFLHLFENINSKIYSLYKECCSYLENNSKYRYMDDDFKEAILDLCDEKKITDNSVLNKIDILEDYCENIEFLSCTYSHFEYSNRDLKNDEGFIDNVKEYLSFKGKAYDSKEESEVLEETEMVVS